MQSYSVEAKLKATGADKFARAFKDAATNVGNFKEIGDKMKGVGKKLTKGLTLPIVGAAAAAMTMGAKFDDQMSTVQAVTGATGDELDNMRELAKKMGSETRYSATESAEGMEMLARAGFETDEILNALPDTLNLASAGAIDLGDASDIASNILSGFGMEAEETSRVADVLAKASADANVDIEGLGESFKYAGPIASDMGISLEDTAASIGTLGDAGIQGGQAGRQLRKGIQSLASPTSEASKAMDDLGIDVFDANGKMKDMPSIISELEGGLEGMSDSQRSSALETLFGADAMSAWSILVNKGGDELGEFSDELTNSEGTAEDMSDTMEDNLAGSMRSLKSAVEGIAISFSELGEGPLRSLVDWVTGLVRKFNDADDSTKQWIAILAGVVAVIGPILLVLGTLVGFIPKVVAGFKIIGAVIAAITSPIGLVVAAIIAAVALIYVYWEPISEFFINMWEKIKEAGLAIWEFLQEAWAGTVEFFVNLWEPIAEFFTDFWETIQEATSEIWESITNAIDVAITFISDIIESTLGFISDIVTSIWEGIKSTIETVVNFIKTIITSVWNAIKSTTTTVFNAIKGVISGVWNGIKAVITTVVNTVKSIVKGAWNVIKSVTTGVFNTVKGVASSVWNGIKSTITNVVNGIKSTVSNIFNSLKGVVTGAFSKVKSAVSDGIDGALGVVTDIAGSFLDAGKNIVGSIADGITGAIGKVTDAIGNVVGKVRDFLPFSPPKTGPLIDIMDVEWGETIGAGIEKGESKVTRSMGKITGMIDRQLDFEPNVGMDVAGQVDSIHRRASREMSYDYNSEIDFNQKQPAYINVSIGNQDFEAFVEDISDVQDRSELVRKAFM